MRVIVVGDVHLSVTPPGRRAEGYLEELMAMLDEIVELANARDAHVIFCGDVFHHKRWSRVPHWLVSEVGYKLSRIRKRVIIVPGNHDLADGSIESLARQPLMLLDWVHNVTVMREEASVEKLEDGLDHIYVLGIAGTAAVTEARDEALELFTQPAHLVVAHAPISVRKMPWPTWQPEQLPIDCNVLVYGHQHDAVGGVAMIDAPDSHPPPHDTYKVPVIAAGCIGRGALHEADHDPTVVALDFGANGVWKEADFIKLTSALPAAEIYRWAEVAEEKATDLAMHTFVEALGQATLVGFSREALIQTIRQRPDVAEPVRAMAAQILEDVGP